MSEEQIKDMILKQCLELTTNNDFRPPISAYNGVDIDDVVRVYKQLKDVIEEAREYIEDWLFNAGGNGASMNYEDINELLQILDKAKELVGEKMKVRLIK